MIICPQDFEDALLWRALSGMPQESYIDNGAHHPTVDSVSRVFCEHGWLPIHIEALPSYAGILPHVIYIDSCIPFAIR